MRKYVVRVPFRHSSSNGDRVVNKGEVICLSSNSATVAVQQGVLLEEHVSGLQDIIATCDARAKVLMNKLRLTDGEAAQRAMKLAASLLIRNNSLKQCQPPSSGFQSEVADFNRNATGNNPVARIQSDTGAGEWAGYNCNIGKGCSHGCVYCYAEKMASRFNRVENPEEWREEVDREVSTLNCRKLDAPIMFPTTHDISPGYLPAYRCHLYNLLKAGNEVILVSKPHRECIEAICSEFFMFRDKMVFRFSIGALDNNTLSIWEPGAPSFSERIDCLGHAFEMGFRTSVSAEPLLVDREGAEKLYCLLEPLVTEDIWFGKMNNVGSFRKSDNPELSRQAELLFESYRDDEILKLVATLNGLPKVAWKDSIKAVIGKLNNSK